MRPIFPDSYLQIDIDEINALAAKNPRLLIERSERLYHEQLEAVADRIVENIGDYRFVMLSGHSASGKTTTSHKLKSMIKARGCGARVVSLDDFYLDKENTPLREDGTHDLETVHALDIPHINYCFSRLLEKGEADFPRFDFTKARRSESVHCVRLPKRGVIIMEGIHALNPLLAKTVPQEGMLKLFVSVRSQFMLKGRILLSPKDVRLIRRMVRDKNFRGAHPIKTMEMWGEVAQGERDHINPFRDSADIKIDSTIDYEPCIYKMFVRPLLEDVSSVREHHGYLSCIYEALGAFVPIGSLLIPKHTVLREFIAL